MARRRIHELAKEWGAETKELLAVLDKLGIRNKRAQSSLGEEEVERLKAEFVVGEKPGVEVGNERIVRGMAGQTLVERRVTSNVIRRRKAKAESEPAALLQESTQAFPLASEGFEPFAVPEAPPVAPAPPSAEEPAAVEAVPAPPAEEVRTQEETAAGLPQEPPVSETPAGVPEATAAEAVEEAATAAEETAAPQEARAQGEAKGAEVRGPVVLGKIDLRKAAAPSAPADPGSREAAARTGRDRGHREGVQEVAEVPPAVDGRPRKKKRRVIKRAGTTEAWESDRRFGRMPRKKKAMPGKEQKKTEITTPRASKRVIRISEVVTVGELARGMGVKVGEVIKKLMDSGVMATINQILDLDTASLIAAEFEYNVENVAFDVESALEEEREGEVEEKLEGRPPVVTIMGHVDHGKTSLLDAVRETNVTAHEAGGITQHIGAYSVDVAGRSVTFLDTPGHEAFTSMRARGAKVTDMVVLVVAADDGVMPQTVEAINHARAAEVPIIVAINKIDKPEANLERIRQGLAEHGLVAEEWGGDTTCVPVSAKTKEGITQLLEMLLLQAEVLELKANADKLARGVIVEAKLDRGRGPVATVLVQEGMLRVGAPFVCGGNYGRVRAMIDDKGRRVEDAGPSMPVEILGLQGVPEAGNLFVAVADEATARQVAQHRRGKQREADLVKTAKVSLEDLYQRIQAGDVKELRVVIKADVQGSVEALSEALARLSTDEVRLKVLHASVGGITESDVLLAAASNAIVIGFSVRPEAKAADVSEREGVDLRLYTVIYDAINELRDAMEGLLEPTVQEKTIGRAEVRQVFNVPNFGVIAGSFVTDGKVTRNASARLVRDHVVVYTGKVSSLRRFKDDAREVQSGYECGIGLENYQDLKAGDHIETFETERVARRLGQPMARAAGAERGL
jgi:translation initiation factor IF-2